MLKIKGARPPADQIESRLEFETLLSDISSRFVNLAPGEVDREIESALGRVCTFLDIDLAVLWQWLDAKSAVVMPTHLWCASEDLRPSELRREEDYPWAVQQVRAGRMFVISSLEDYPPEAAVDRETCRRSGIKAGLCIPLAVGGEPPVGALGINALRAEREWPTALLTRLQLLAQILANALARRRADEALRTSEARLRSGADLAGLGFYDVDYSERVLYADERLRALCGIPEDRLQGLGALEFWKEHLHPDDLPRVMGLRRQLEDGSLEHLAFRYRYLHPVRGEIWIHHQTGTAARDAAGRLTRSYGVLRDVTREQHGEVLSRDLSQRLIQAHEAERARLARELHDDLSQRLAVLAIDIGRAELATQDRARAAELRGAREELVRMSDDVHSLAYQLHPSVLAELGLAEALRAECERLGRQGQIDVAACLAPEPEAVGQATALCLFRVAQEALSNVLHHAVARTATVELRSLDGGLRLTVEDDGIGFDPESPRASRSLGLLSMRERVELVNGTLELRSVPGGGTAVVAWVPVEGVTR
jgi:signal transduction histidine kinase